MHTFCKRQVLVKAWPGCIGVLSGTVTSIGLPGPAISQVATGAADVFVGDEVGLGVGVAVADDGVAVKVGVAVDGTKVAAGAVRAACVRRASTVWKACVTPMVGLS